MEPDASNAEKKASENYVDADGFVRKKSKGLGFALWFGVGIASFGIRSLPDDLNIIALLTLPILAYLLLTAIQMGSTHDISTWKGTPYVKFWIFLGSMVAGLLGLIVYFILKRREQAYLRRTHILQNK
jgi:hypothetical protein